MKNWIIGILTAIIGGMLAYYFTSLNDIGEKGFTQTTKGNKIIVTENATITIADSVSLSENQLARMKVYQQLTDEMVAYSENKDTLPIDCGTRLTPTEYDQITATFDDVCTPEKIPADTNKIIEYPLYIHIVKASEQQNLITGAAISQAIIELNNKFAKTKIRFAVKGTQNIISPQFTNTVTGTEHLFIKKMKKIGFLNIFIFSTLATASGQALNGYTTFTLGDDFIAMTATAMQNGSTLPHETGHFFLLYHTHGKTNAPTDELVNGNSCSCSGDDVCDTPADPNLFGIVNSTCIYNGTATDNTGATYKPDPKNLMSYAHPCRSYFSNGQNNRMRWAALTQRNYF